MFLRLYKILALLTIVIFIITSTCYAQFGVRAGVNMANQIKSLRQTDIIESFQKDNLSGYQIGVIYELFPAKSIVGYDMSLIVSQKGFSYTDSLSLKDNIILGYREINYLEMPLNFRWRYRHKLIGAFGTAGIYGGIVLNDKSVNETNITSSDKLFKNIGERLDYGYNFGAGVEILKKIQLGLTWSYGLKNRIKYSDGQIVTSSTDTDDNKVFTVNLVYMFK